MSKPLGTRLSAALLLLLFTGLGGGLGVSGVDVLLYHWDSGSEPPTIHVEQAGADCHSEVCFLGYTVSDGRFLTTAAQQPTVQSVDGADNESPLRVASTLPLRQVSPLPRAPPLIVR